MSAGPTFRSTVDTGHDISSQIDSNFFGGNILFDKDDLDGTFADKFDDLHLNLMRFPGGGIAESYFDITNPDAIGVADMADYQTFSEFMAFCLANSITPAIVIPTKRYLGDIASGEADVAAFVQSVTNGTYGSFPEIVFEIGNEYYASTVVHDAISSNAYGEIASRLALAASDAAQSAVKVVVQAGRSKANNNDIISHFDTGAEIDAVDGIIIHQYPWRFEPVERRIDKSLGFLEAWENVGVDSFSFMSEWNIGSSSDSSTDDQHDYGLAQNPALLEMTYQTIVAGIDYSAIWGVQQSTKTSLGRNEGDGRLLAAGVAFQLLSEVLVGKTALAQTVSTPSDQFASYAYHDSDEVAVFVAARDFDDAAGPLTVEIDLTGIGAEFSSIRAVKLSTNDPITQPRVDPITSEITPQITTEGDNPIISVSFDKDYEIIRLLFAKSSAQTADVDRDGDTGDDIIAGGLGDDVLRGHQGEDFLTAHAGDDILRGGGGGDQILGGSGEDTIVGGAGHDMILGEEGADDLSGASGRDTIKGGQNNDRIDGGVGRDHLHGGSGNDTITGGEGRDRMWGDEGADIFVFNAPWDLDRIYDFTAQEDRLDFSSNANINSLNDVTIDQSGPHTTINTSDGQIILRDFAASLLTTDEFMF
jgi:Ca2+-binding RTX toxin-like protein